MGIARCYLSPRTGGKDSRAGDVLLKIMAKAVPSLAKTNGQKTQQDTLQSNVKHCKHASTPVNRSERDQRFHGGNWAT